MSWFFLIGLPVAEGAIAASLWRRRSRDAKISAARVGFWVLVVDFFGLALTSYCMLAGFGWAETVFGLFSLPLALIGRIDPRGLPHQAGFLVLEMSCLAYGMAGFLLALWLGERR